MAQQLPNIPIPAQQRKPPVRKGTTRLNILPTVTWQDLTKDRLVTSLPFYEVEGRFNDVRGKLVPVLGGIVLWSRLGQGAMGTVYYGIHTRLDIEVAIKVLPFNVAEEDPDTVQRFFREAQLAAKLDSPHLVRVQDVNEGHGLFYLVMEYVNGMTAGAYHRNVQRTGKMGLTELEVLDISIGICEGLSVAHRAGIIHRDIKPDNIFIPRRLQADGKTYDQDLELRMAKLGDLGLARGGQGVRSMTMKDACMGTPGYMSPEQGLNAKESVQASDVFSVGASMYDMLCGKRPFNGHNLLEVITATIGKPHEPVRNFRKDVSDKTIRIIDHCMEKEISRRYADGEKLLMALQDARRAIGPKSGINANAPTKPDAEAPSTFKYGDPAAVAVAVKQASGERPRPPVSGQGIPVLKTPQQITQLNPAAKTGTNARPVDKQRKMLLVLIGLLSITLVGALAFHLTRKRSAPMELTQASELLQNWKGAVDQYVKEFNLDPNSKEAQKWLTHDVATALSAELKVLRLQPDDPEASKLFETHRVRLQGAYAGFIKMTDARRKLHEEWKNVPKSEKGIPVNNKGVPALDKDLRMKLMGLIDTVLKVDSNCVEANAIFDVVDKIPE